MKGEGIATLGELIAFCNRRGSSWWRSIPRIGAGRVAIVVVWLRRHETDLGLRVDADVDTRDPLVAAEVVQVRPSGADHIDAGGAGQPAATVRMTLAPLERMAVPNSLPGADGENRSVAFCYIQARHDLEAVRANLNKYHDVWRKGTPRATNSGRTAKSNASPTPGPGSSPGARNLGTRSDEWSEPCSKTRNPWKACLVNQSTSTRGPRRLRTRAG
jgi:hypothetical protein